MRGIGVAAQRGTNATQLVSSNCGADTATADQQPNLRRTILDCFTNLFCVVRIIVRNGTIVSAEIDELMTGAAQFIDHPLVERKTPMIGADCETHDDLQQRARVLQDVFDVEP